VAVVADAQPLIRALQVKLVAVVAVVAELSVVVTLKVLVQYYRLQ
jgi:hypothetical protein